ncbi:MAG: fibronectin type III domain-containing protein [Candidatus Kerfeldbacteria bacterium]|nr:fibronectin type III domain-containing protein [Candidatus Kerfeldbacteria bacterium]
MVHLIVALRQKLVSTGDSFNSAEDGFRHYPRFVQFLTFIPLAIARTLVNSAIFIVSIPLHLIWSPQQSFQKMARRHGNGEYLDSYSALIRQNRLAVISTTLLLLAAGIQLSILGFGLVELGKPTPAAAVSSSVTLNPTWDRTGEYDATTCDTFSYACESATATSLKVDFLDTSCVGTDREYRLAMKFDLSSIPNNATITDVSLTVNVSDTTTATVEYFPVTTDTPDTVSCTAEGSSLFETLGSGTNYTTATNWNTTGAKTVDLGTTADSNVQTRLTGSDLIAIGIRHQARVTNVGAISSVDASSNKPQLVISYTTPPPAPTAFGHTANTTTSVSWNWTDNAATETRYDVHNASHANVTGCTNLAANSTSCTETGLSANTQYTRHANVTDAQGNTDSSSASAYSSIETPTGVSFSNVTTSSITVTATGTLSNLTSGSSGLFFQNTNLTTDSGWIQTTAWTESGLSPNTSNPYAVKARNGNSDETATTASQTKYTLAANPNVTSTRATSTWYNTGTFTFDDQNGFFLGGQQYYRYVWNQSVTQSFSGSESTWSNNNANCPGGSCTSVGTSLSRTASVDGNNWYLHLQSFNTEDVATGTGTDFGPYYFDATNPTIPATVNDGTGADATYSTSLTQLSANWTASTDTTSGLAKYQYAIGTTSGGTQVLGYTDNGASTSVTKTGLSLTSGTTYYVSTRAVDNAGNSGSSTSSNGVTVNTSLPTISDNQTGDTAPRKASGTTYDVDFAKAAAGPQLDYGQYAVYSGAGKTGTLLKDWTNIFTADTDSYSINWTVDFASLQEGTNYVSVRAFALDGLSNEVDDVFTILKDTQAPVISSFVATTTTNSATLTWTTNGPASTQVEWGTTVSYGNTTTLDPSLTTSHRVSLSGLATNTEFHARALSTDEAGNAAVSTDLSFTTLATPMTVITNVQVAVLSSTSVIVTWTTNEPATSKVRYGPTTDYGSEASDLNLATSHSLTITGLEPNTTYHYEVISTGSTTDSDADATFTTQPEAGQTVISNLRVVAGETEATFIWMTNEPATSKARLGLTDTYGIVKSNTKLVTAHQLRVPGLDSGTTYHFQITSTGMTTAVTDDDTFTTNTPESTKNRAISPTVTTLIISDGQEPVLTVPGVAKGGQTLRLYVDGKVVKTIKVDGDSKSTKSFAAAISLKEFKSGKHILYVQATDEVGRTSIVRQKITFTVGTDAKRTTIKVGKTLKYAVQPGDSLWRIAERYLGAGNLYPLLVKENAKALPGLVRQPNVIQSGWVLTIPTR